MLVAYHHGKHLCSHEEQRFLLLLLLGNCFHIYNDLVDNSIDREKQKGFLCEERQNNETNNPNSTELTFCKNFSLKI